MNVLLMTGSHPRHAYLARCLHECGVLAGLIIEKRESHVPDPPEGIAPELAKLFVHHFEKRQAAEEKFFGKGKLPIAKRLDVTREALNSDSTQRFIRSIKPDLLLSYGVHMLSDETIKAAPKERWNIHGGLSPWYRGNITHFWPSYFLEPQMTGMTVHELTQQLDAGAVIHQNCSELVAGDGVHDLACRAVFGLGEEIPKLFDAVGNKEEIDKHHHKTTGRIWTSKDWHPHHLRLIYEMYNDQIVDAYLNGDLVRRDPKLHRQF